MFLEANAAIHEDLCEALFVMHFDTALITGASSGIGLHLAHQFAFMGHPVVLVARQKQELEGVAVELTARYGLMARVIAKDLEKPEAAQEIYDELAAEKIGVGVLVNNAGVGFRGRSWEVTADQELAMIHLNVEAALRLTRLFLPPMFQRQRGRILNTVSVAGFEPGPMMNVYHATKAFLLSWSEGLAVELEGTGITVTALCPGPTDTDFFTKAGMTAVRGFQKAPVLAPQDVAQAGYEAMVNGELVVVPGGMNKALVVARRVLTDHAQAKLNEMMYEEVSPSERTRHRGDVETAAAH